MSGVVCHNMCLVSHVRCNQFLIYFFDKLVKLVGRGSVINEAYRVYFKQIKSTINKKCYVFCYIKLTYTTCMGPGKAPRLKQARGGLAGEGRVSAIGDARRFQGYE